MKLTEDRILEISNHISEDMGISFKKSDLIQVIEYWMNQHNQKNNELIILKSKVVIKMLETINFVEGKERKDEIVATDSDIEIGDRVFAIFGSIANKYPGTVVDIVPPGKYPNIKLGTWTGVETKNSISYVVKCDDSKSYQGKTLWIKNEQIELIH